VGGTVRDPSVAEFSALVQLERFENKGLISLQDGREGDAFRISAAINAINYTGNYFVDSGILFNGCGQSTLRRARPRSR
jgi:hypothetical protein